MSTTTEADEMRPEYNFSKGIRNKHSKAYKEGTNVVFLDADVAKIFKDSESVNHALRMLINIAGKEIVRNLTKSST